MAEDQTTIIFRIERQLKEEFEQIAAATERTISQYLRAFIKDQIKKHREAATIAPESTNATAPLSPPRAATKTPQKPRKGQKLNRIPPRKTKP
jgi:predicted DNA-binding protein